MPPKQPYQELEKRLKDLERESLERSRLEALLADTKARLKKADEKILQEIIIREGAEEKIKHQIDRLEVLIEYSSFAIVTLDEKRRIISCNRNFEMLFQYKAPELSGRSLDEMIAGKGDLEDAVSFTRKVLAGDPVHGSGKRCRKDGTPIEVEFFGVPMVTGGRVEGAFCIYKNISELRQAAEALQESEEKYRKLYEESKKAEERYRSLLHSSADAIVIYDLEGRTRYVSPTFTQFFGWAIEEVKGKQMPFLPESEKKRSLAAISEFIENGLPCRGFETKRLTKDGRLLEVSISASFYDDHRGRPAGVLVILRDISDRKSLEAQLFQAHKMEAVGTLAGGIAHDFNNILQAISGYSQLLIIGKDPNDPDYPKLEAIDKSVRKAADLTRQLLIFSRKIESKLRPVDFNQEVLQVRTLLEGALPKMIRIELDLAEDLHVINADPVQLEQIIMNLGFNAMDAMQDGGRLIFKTGNRHLDNEFCVNHIGSNPGEYVILSISDTGEGMGSEILEHIFEPFFTTKEIGKGTGLGLAMAYGIVKNHGGYIKCTSEVGEGTTFDIYFPAQQTGEIERSKEPVGEAIIPGRGETILLVDDERNIRNVARDMLNRFGYNVLTAISGEEALETFEGERGEIDLIILDLNMPGMGGHRCLEELLQIEPKAKVIIASGYSANRKAREAIKSGALGFITKPYHYTEILKSVRKAIDKGGQAS